MPRRDRCSGSENHVLACRDSRRWRGSACWRSKLHQDTVRALALPDVRGKLTAAGLETVGSAPDEFAARIRAEIASKGALVRAAGAKPG